MSKLRNVYKKIISVKDIESMELCGPYECPCCGNCVVLSAPCIDDQAEPKVNCPYCDKIIWVPEWEELYKSLLEDI